MFKIKGGSAEYIAKSIRLPSEMINKVQSLADENNLSFNSVIIQCVEYALEHIENNSYSNNSENN